MKIWKRQKLLITKNVIHEFNEKFIIGGQAQDTMNNLQGING